MKTFLPLLSFASALAVPATFAAEAVGVSVPAALDPTHAFAAFVVALIALVAFGDYAKRAPRLVGCTERRHARARAAHPLAA